MIDTSEEAHPTHSVPIDDAPSEETEESSTSTNDTDVSDLNNPFPCFRCRHRFKSHAKLMKHTHIHTMYSSVRCTHPGCKKIFIPSSLDEARMAHFKSHPGFFFFL